MNQLLKDKLLRINDALIDEAKAVVASQFHPKVMGASTLVNIQLFHKWWGKVQSLAHQLGTAAKPWQELFSSDPERCTLAFTQRVLGTLEAIRHELANDHLETVTQFVRAETLGDLLDQAEHLFKNGYYLAAGVIGRAVLEEHLRTTCDTLSCSPAKNRPTINDFNQSLYGVQHYNLIKMKQIEMLASIGNDAAHNKPNLNPNDVRKILTDLPEVLESTRA